MAVSTVSVDTSALEQALRRYAVEACDQLGAGLVRHAQGYSSRRSGELHDSIEAEPSIERADGASCRVFVGAEHGRYQDEGTGIYGPEGQPIRPKHGNVLVFDWPAAGGIVFARSVRGSEPTRFWTKAVAEWPQIVSEVQA